MRISRSILCLTFLLFASAALAAKPDKTLVCHVGSQLGSMGETYQDNPDCTIAPEWVGDPADYICPDAGKIDLILVSKKAKHIGNPSHSFEDGTGYPWEDYSPEDGVGDDPLDFEEDDVLGIDRGCELVEENLSCPCLSGYTQQGLIDRIDAQSGSSVFACFLTTETVDIVKSDVVAGTYISITTATNTNYCSRAISEGEEFVGIDLDEQTSALCYDELAAIIPKLTGCP